MWQVLVRWHLPFSLPWIGNDLTIFGYGVMLVIGLLIAMRVSMYLARRTGLDPEVFANAAVLALVSGIAGARLSHVLENLPTYTDPHLSFWENFRNAINIRQGGLTYYGGFLLATPTLILYAIWKKVPIRVGMDIIAPCLMIGLGFGRIGCFLNGCCFGAECTVPWAVEFPYGSDAYVTEFNANLLRQPVPLALLADGTAIKEYLRDNGMKELQEPLPPPLFKELHVAGSLVKKEVAATEAASNKEFAAKVASLHANPVHPAEIYSSIVAFTIAGFLFCYYTIPHTPGRVFAAMMMIEGVFRYMLEVIRVEPPVVGRGTTLLPDLPPQSYSMCVSFFLVLIGSVLWFAFRPRRPAARPDDRTRPARIVAG